MWYSITLTVGILLLIISLFLLRESLSFLKTTERAVATVTELEPVKGDDGVTYRPVFKFKTHTNEEVIYRSFSSSSPPTWYVGEEATIAYDANNPKTARIVNYFGVFSWTVVLMAIAMPLIVIGGGYFLAKLVLK